MPHHLIKICKVCSNRAIAFNFNGLTCESCKSFFRRNAVKMDKFKCLKGGNCLVTKETRNLCKRCRLTKCYTIGMKKEMVLDTRIKKKEKENENSLLVSLAANKSNSQIMEVILKEVVDEQLFESSSNGSVENENDSNFNNFYLKTFFNQETSLSLSQLEHSLIEEINTATRIHFKEELQLPVKGEIATFTESLNLPGVYIMHIIRFCKLLPPFAALNQADQMTILKPYFTELLLARFTFAYNHQEDSFSVYSNDEPKFALWMKVGRLEEVGNESLAAFAKEYRQFIIATQKEMENDVTIRNLLITLLMFHPREELSNPEFLRYHFFVYQHLLQRYLEEKYQNQTKADFKWDRLQVVLSEICKFRVPICDLYTLVEVQEVETVLTEIYDLNVQMSTLSIDNSFS